eukprot:9493827-Pyramimonas_sp.AAC.1
MRAQASGAAAIQHGTRAGGVSPGSDQIRGWFVPRILTPAYVPTFPYSHAFRRPYASAHGWAQKPSDGTAGKALSPLAAAPLRTPTARSPPGPGGPAQATATGPSAAPGDGKNAAPATKPPAPGNE